MCLDSQFQAFQLVKTEGQKYRAEEALGKFLTNLTVDSKQCLIGSIDELSKSMTEEKKLRFYSNLIDVMAVMLTPSQDLEAKGSIIPDNLNLSSGGS